MKNFPEIVSSVGSALRGALPEATLARYASLALSLAILSLVFSIAVTQIFLTLTGALYAAHWLRDRPKVTFPSVKAPLLSFCLLTMAAALASPDVPASLSAVRKLILFFIILFVANLIQTARHLNFLMKALFVEASLVSLVAMFQFYRLYQTLQLQHPGEVYLYMTFMRITGLLSHWMNFSGQQMLILAALVAFLAAIRRVHRIWWTAFVLISISLLLSFTRSAWLGVVAAGLLVAALRFRRYGREVLWSLPALTMLAAVLGFFGPEIFRQRLRSIFRPANDRSVSIRFEIWRVGLKMIQRHPGLGVGPSVINQVYESYIPPGRKAEQGYHGHLHNNLLQLAAERGLACLVAWVWLMVTWARDFFRLRLRLGKLDYVADAGLAAWAALLVAGMFEFNFGTSPVLMMFLFFVSAPYAAEAIQSRRHEPEL